jgi:hypothetical protein
MARRGRENVSWAAPLLTLANLPATTAKTRQALSPYDLAKGFFLRRDKTSRRCIKGLTFPSFAKWWEKETNAQSFSQGIVLATKI